MKYVKREALSIHTVVAGRPPSFPSADLHELTNLERTTSKNLFLEYGPTPRICIDFIKMPSKFAEFRSHRARAISDLNLDSLLQFV